MLQRIMDEVGLELNQEEAAPLTPFLKSPYLMMQDRPPSMFRKDGKQVVPVRPRSLPKYLALDLTRLHNLDGKFLLGPPEPSTVPLTQTRLLSPHPSFGLARVLSAACEDVCKERHYNLCLRCLYSRRMDAALA